MKLSRTVTYAVQATLQLARSGSRRPVPCSQLAADGEMPERFLLQILRKLVNKKILQSTRGVDGGYILNRSPEDISLLEVIEAIDGPLDPGFPRIEGLAQDSISLLNEALATVTKISRSQLKSINLTSLLPPTQPTDEVEGSEPIEPDSNTGRVRVNGEST